jgi:hypothetical protein
MMIQSSEISVIVQGPVHGTPSQPPHQQITRMNLQCLRRSLPDVQIILSTWEGTNVDSLDYDILVINKDPGSLKVHGDRDNNINRQIITTFNGLKKADRKYAIKLRTDCSIYHNAILDILDMQMQLPSNNLQLFRNKIILSEIGTFSPLHRGILFHPSDIFQSGLREDLLDYWNTPFETEEETLHWNKRVRKRRLFSFAPNVFQRHTPEQHLFISFLDKHNVPVNIRFFDDFSSDMIIKSEKFLGSNFSIFRTDRLGLAASSHLWNDGLTLRCYREHQFHELEQLCNEDLPDSHVKWQKRYVACKRNHYLRACKHFFIDNFIVKILSSLRLFNNSHS